jgi:hypothetical protein
VTGDNFAQEWVAAAWSKCGVRYVKSELPKSQIYLECVPSWTRGLVSIPDHKRLLRELRLLERHTHRSGRDTVDHGKSGSDDYANAVAGVLRDLSSQLSYLEALIRATAEEDEDPSSEAARAARDQAYRNEFAARIFHLSGGQNQSYSALVRKPARDHAPGCGAAVAICTRSLPQSRRGRAGGGRARR